MDIFSIRLSKRCSNKTVRLKQQKTKFIYQARMQHKHQEVIYTGKLTDIHWFKIIDFDGLKLKSV